MPEFDWDSGNLEHIARHDITADEALEVIGSDPALIRSEERDGEDRHLVIGETSSGRLLMVVWTWRQNKVRVITAFPAKRRFRRQWARNQGGADGEEKT
ncbi:MAG: BrnT family toxin [Bryobacteraceae bacterium]|nr:BrnT family toxin [Bryobacteraceae bacterium]